MQTFRPTPLHSYESSGTPHPVPPPETPVYMQSPVSQDMYGMDKKKFRTLVLILAIISLIVFIVIIALLGNGGSRTPVQTDSQVVTTVKDDGSIVVTAPKNGDAIEPPIVITGQAKGYWFNQGFFPVAIYDVDKTLVAQTYAIAEGDWSDTQKMVPFRAKIDTYDKTPLKKAGHIVFKKGNIVTGISDDEFLIAVEFTKKSRTGATTGKVTTSTSTSTTSSSSTNSTSSSTSAVAACRDGKDNDGDGLVDTRDPGCHTDGNAANSASFSINDTSEVNAVSSSTTNSSNTTNNSNTTNTNNTNNVTNTTNVTNNSSTYCRWKNPQTGACLNSFSNYSIMQTKLQGFVQFIREQGVIGLAVGFILGGAVSKTVTSLVDNVINPIIGLLLGRVNLADKALVVGEATLKWGAFVSTIIDFVIISAVVYFIVRGLGLDKIDAKKE